jgi:hypothetical protein
MYLKTSERKNIVGRDWRLLSISLYKTERMLEDEELFYPNKLSSTVTTGLCSI